MESTKAQVAARLGAELPHSTVLGEIPRSPHTPNKNVFLEAMEDVVFGSIAGIAGKFIEYPFDTVKVRLQSQSSLHPQYTGPLDCFRQSFARDGLAGLYRGISAPLVGAALENSSLFLSEQLAQKMMFASGMYRSEEKLPLEALFVTGGAAGAVTSLVLTPVELVKCKMQVPDSAPAINTAAGRPPPTILGIIRDVYQHNGMKGFWHGQMGTFIRETGGGAAWFGSKETVSALFRKYNAAPVAEGGKLEPLPLWQQAVAGASAGMAYNFLFFPADTIKSRMQTSAIQTGAKQVQQTFMSEGKALWKAKGIRGMYAGCGITVFRAAPSSAFVFIIYDGMKHMFAFA